jgi:hypothetical protein
MITLWVDDGGRAIDLEDGGRGADGDHHAVVDGACGPFLAADADPAVAPADLLQDVGRFTEQRVDSEVDTAWGRQVSLRDGPHDDDADR